MEGTAQTPRLADYDGTHEIGCAGGHHYAWKPVPGDELAGELTHGDTEAELLAKLGAAPGG
jgi:hypothetical protein